MDIYVIGSCNTTLKSGKYSVVLDDNGDKDVFSKKCFAKSSNAVLLQGIKDGISRCKNHDNVKVYINTSVGWHNKNKSKNKMLIESIQSDCLKRDIAVNVIENTDTTFVKQIVTDYTM